MRSTIACVTMVFAFLLGATQAPDISGTWVAKRETPFGEIEVVWELKVADGKVTGVQKLPFGDAPIVDGRISRVLNTCLYLGFRADLADRAEAESR